MHHHRIDRGLLEQHDVAGKILRGLLVAHGMAAILDDDGFLVILLHVRQRFGQDAGLVERGDFGHEADLAGGILGPRSIRLAGGAQSVAGMPLRSPDGAKRNPGIYPRNLSRIALRSIPATECAYPPPPRASPPASSRSSPIRRSAPHMETANGRHIAARRGRPRTARRRLRSRTRR